MRICCSWGKSSSNVRSERCSKSWLWEVKQRVNGAGLDGPSRLFGAHAYGINQFLGGQATNAAGLDETASRFPKIGVPSAQAA